MAQRLQIILVGATVQEAFSQEKDELMLAFGTAQGPFYLKAIQTPTFSSLQFPETFNRARQNSVDLFQPLLGEEVEEVRVHQQERSFYISFTGQKVLLFKLFGNRSNVILFQEDQATELFHRKLTKDLALDYRAMDQNWHLQQESFLASSLPLQKQLPTLGEIPLLYLKEKGYDQAPPEQQWGLVQHMLQLLDKPTFYLTYITLTPRLSLLPIGEVSESFTDPLKALNAFVPRYRAEEYYSRNYAVALKTLERQLEVAQKIWYQIQEKLETWHHGTPYAQTADVIMANLTTIPLGAQQVELFDFYQEKNRLIKLHTTETPQKTAERLYKKAKNQKIELTLLQERAAKKEAQVETLTLALERLKETKTASQLRAFLKEHTLAAPAAAPADTPYYQFEEAGFKILVGKNAKANDKLTLKHTHKDDLWLHAKDVPGSHVVVKLQPGKPFPSQVIEKAAQLAAFYSKRKSDSLCPVLYTPKKYVRKPKGAAPGSVVVEREKVMLVKPGNPFKQTFE
nr:NFACT RNA binding domain-containing protein [Rufibacter sp. LB8]